MTWSNGAVVRSNHGESSGNGRGNRSLWKTRSAQIICIHVVPLFERVLMTMSPDRKGNPVHRQLSSSGDTYRTGMREH